MRIKASEQIIYKIKYGLQTDLLYFKKSIITITAYNTIKTYAEFYFRNDYINHLFNQELHQKDNKNYKLNYVLGVLASKQKTVENTRQHSTVPSHISWSNRSPTGSPARGSNPSARGRNLHITITICDNFLTVFDSKRLFNVAVDSMSSQSQVKLST